MHQFNSIMIDSVISTFGQVLVFTAIPFIVYLVRFQKKTDFLSFIGLMKSPPRANLHGLLLMVALGAPLLIISFVDPAFMEILTGPGTVSGRIRQMGFGMEGVLTVVLFAVFKTAMAEEILFRGFIAKRLIAWLGFQNGNMVQAVLFGAIHTLLFLTLTDNVLFLILFFLIPGGVAYLMVLINEKVAGGSIIPGWIAHASGNVLSYSFFAFVV